MTQRLNPGHKARLQSRTRDGGNARVTGGNVYTRRQGMDADWLAAREPIKAQR